MTGAFELGIPIELAFVDIDVPADVEDIGRRHYVSKFTHMFVINLPLHEQRATIENSALKEGLWLKRSGVQDMC